MRQVIRRWLSVAGILGAILILYRPAFAASPLPPPQVCDLKKAGSWVGLPGDERIDLHFALAADRGITSPFTVDCQDDGALIVPSFTVDLFTDTGKLVEHKAQRYRYNEICGIHSAIELPGDRSWMVAFPDLGQPWKRVDTLRREDVLLDDLWDLLEGSFRTRDSTLGAHDGKVVYREVRQISPVSDLMAATIVLEYPAWNGQPRKHYSGITVFLNPQKKDLDYLVNSKRYSVSLKAYAGGDDIPSAVPFMGQYSNGDLVVMLLGIHLRPTVVSLNPKGDFLSDEPDAVEDCN